MLPIVLFGLVASVLAGNIPPPKLTYLSAGDIQLTLDAIPGAENIYVIYRFGMIIRQGPFHQKADGRWIHVNHAAKYNGIDDIKYTITATLDGEVRDKRGTLTPGKVGVAALPLRKVRIGTVVFRDDFNGAFDLSGWDYEVSMYGGYNWEFQAYVPDARNIFTRDGHLFIKPTLTTEHPDFNDGNMNSATMDLNALYGYCTNVDRFGCVRKGIHGTIPAVMSGKIKSKQTIRFGKVEVRARVPRGNWIWPAIWMLPRDHSYGGWPRSGEIDIMESRGNSKAADDSGRNHGVKEVGATMHWGLDPVQNRFRTTHGSGSGDWSHDMHTYRLEWTIDHIIVFVDHHVILSIPITQNFWEKGGFNGSNLWSRGTIAAPFDKPFHLILNVAIGGTNGFFPDGWTYDQKKPWSNNSPTANGDLWNARNEWLKTWNGDDVAMEIDYVEMTQY